MSLFLDMLKEIRDVLYPEVVTKHGDVVASQADVISRQSDVVSKHDIVLLAQSDVITRQSDVVSKHDIVLLAQSDVEDIQADVVLKHDAVVEEVLKILGLSAASVTGASDTSASASYNSATGVMTFVIPQGIKGDRGDAFAVNVTGLLADRALYDDQPMSFSYNAVDDGNIYFKLSATTGDWSIGTPFGKGDTGEQGESINMQVAVGNLIQYQYPSEGETWHTLIDLDAVVAGAYLASDGVAVDSAKLGGQLPAYYLPATAQAADSAKLGGQLPAYYLPATAQAADSAKLGGQLPNIYLSTDIIYDNTGTSTYTLPSDGIYLILLGSSETSSSFETVLYSHYNSLWCHSRVIVIDNGDYNSIYEVFSASNSHIAEFLRTDNGLISTVTYALKIIRLGDN